MFSCFWGQRFGPPTDPGDRPVAGRAGRPWPLRLGSAVGRLRQGVRWRSPGGAAAAGQGEGGAKDSESKVLLEAREALSHWSKQEEQAPPRPEVREKLMLGWAPSTPEEQLCFMPIGGAALNECSLSAPQQGLPLLPDSEPCTQHRHSAPAHSSAPSTDTQHRPIAPRPVRFDSSRAGPGRESNLLGVPP